MCRSFLRILCGMTHGSFPTYAFGDNLLDFLYTRQVAETVDHFDHIV